MGPGQSGHTTALNIRYLTLFWFVIGLSPEELSAREGAHSIGSLASEGEGQGRAVLWAHLTAP